MHGFGADNSYDLRKVESWSGARKAAVARAFNKVEKLKRRGAGTTSEVRLPRNKKKRDAVLRAAQLPLSKKWKKALFPFAGEVTVDKKGNVSVSTGKVKRVVVQIPPEKLAIDPEGAVADAIVPGSNYFGIVAGQHEVMLSETINNSDGLVGRIRALQMMYTSGEKSWEKWLHGIVCYKANKKEFFNDQERVRAYRQFKRRWKNAKKTGGNRR